jgi:hypothetical protein
MEVGGCKCDEVGIGRILEGMKFKLGGIVEKLNGLRIDFERYHILMLIG